MNKMKIIKRIVYAMIVAAIISSPLSAQVSPTNTSPETDNYLLTSISKWSERCVVIGGYTESYDANFFIYCCPDRVDLKKTAFVGFIKDLDFIREDLAWTLISGSIVKVERHKLVEVDFGTIRNNSFETVKFVDAGTGWAIGADGLIVVTHDGGRTWQKQASNTKFDLVDILFTKQNVGWILGNNFQSRGSERVLLKTTDNGVIWRLLSKEPFKRIERLFFIDSNVGWATTVDDQLLFTDDGGDKWTTRNSGKLRLKDFVFVDRNNGWALTKDGIYKSEDGGSSWGLNSKLPLVEPYEFSRILFTSGLDGWAFSDKLVLHTTNGGFSWQKLEFQISPLQRQ